MLIVITAAYWQIAFDSLAVNGTEVAGSTFAIVDTVRRSLLSHLRN